MKPAAVRFAAFLVGFYLLASGVQANAAIVITRSELSGGQLRVEGQGAQPNAPISVNGTVRGTADAGGRFKILAANFSSPTCSVTVSDGVTSAAASLIGCTSAPPPPPASLSAVTIGSTSVTGGNSAQGTVSLSSAAPSTGAVVALSSGNTNVATVPASVTVVAGAISASFTINTVSVAVTVTPVVVKTYVSHVRVSPLTYPRSCTDVEA